MPHGIAEMGAEKIVCSCTWTFRLAARSAWGTPAGQDQLLDEHSTHVASMRVYGL